MDAKTLYGKLLKLTGPWEVVRVEVDEAAHRVDVWVDHEPGVRVACPVCGEFGPVYDHAEERAYRHLDSCEMETYVHVRLPRSQCKAHGVRQILSEFGENGSAMTFAFEKRMIAMLGECSLSGVQRLAGITWDQSWAVVERAVGRGFERKEKRLPERIGIDEKSFAKGHKYETRVYDLDQATVEYVADNREANSLAGYYRQFTLEERQGVKAVAMDMWEPYYLATREWIPEAPRKIVFDRFHVMGYVTKAVDQVRKQECRQLVREGRDDLKHTKYLWLWNEENIPEWRREEFAQLKAKDLKVSRAWAMKENLRNLWSYRSEAWARKFFEKWCRWVKRSRIAPMMQAAKTIQAHLDNVVTFARLRITNAMGESLNSKIEKVKRMACGFRNREHYKTAIYFHCGGLDLLPVPPLQPRIRFSTC
jgi:transposase